MDEDTVWIKWLLLFLTVVMLNITTCEVYQKKKIADLVESGVTSPLGAKCAIRDDTRDICASYLLELQK